MPISYLSPDGTATILKMQDTTPKMIEQSRGKLKVIKIVDPLLCVRCDNAYIADVVSNGGERQKMFYCSRLDCDNWVCGNCSTCGKDSLNEAA